MWNSDERHGRSKVYHIYPLSNSPTNDKLMVFVDHCSSRFSSSIVPLDPPVGLLLWLLALTTSCIIVVLQEAPQGSGAPLYCGNVLAGLEASAGMGLMVYTPVVRYLDWLRTNTRTSSPEQHFNLH